MAPTNWNDPTAFWDSGLLWSGSPPQPRKKTNMSKAKLDLQGKKDDTLGPYATGVKNALTTNAATFTASSATPTLLGTKTTAFTTNLQAVKDGIIAQQTLVDTKDAARAELEEVLRTASREVDEVAKG